MRKQATSPPAVPAVSIDAVRVRARAELHRDLAKYFGQTGRTHQDLLDLAPLFSQYALALLDAMALRQAGLTTKDEDYKRALDEIAGVVLNEIRPPTDETPATTEELLNNPPPPLPEEPRGVWEDAIHRAWIEARWNLGGQNPAQNMDVHPFQGVLRQPALGNAVIAALGRAIRDRLPEHKARFLENATEPTVSQKTSTSGHRSKPGPKPDIDTAHRIRETVEAVTNREQLNSKLNEVCEALDEAEIPVPKTWKARKPPIRDWSDASGIEPELAKKAILYRLKVGKS